MDDLDALAEETCRKFLTAAQLKTLCRLRGFPVSSGPKAALVESASLRLLSPTGAEGAMASLSPEWSTVLHAIALAESPPGLDDLLPVLLPGVSSWKVDFRRLFSKVADGLLTCGAVLVQDRQGYFYAGRSRYERLVFVLPDSLRPLLPHFPIETAKLPETASGAEPVAFAKEALVRATRLAADDIKADGGLLDRVAASISFADRSLDLDGRPLVDPARLLTRIRKEWARGRHGKGKARRATARQAAAHVLSHLPPGEGVTRARLGGAVKSLGGSEKQARDRAFLLDGVRAGLLLEGGAEEHLYRSIPEAQAPEVGALAFTATEDGILADVDTSGLGALLEVASLSRVGPLPAHLLLVPDPVRLGRAVDRFSTLPALAQAVESSPAYASAVERARRRAGRTLLHSKLTVLRVDEPLLLTTLTHRLSDSVHPLGGPWLAIVAGAVPKALSVAEKEGFKPRRIS